MIKEVYIVQANYLYGKDAYLPYAAGVIAAFAWSDKRVKDNYSLARIVFKREKINDVVQSFENPYLVAFSNYVWNYEYNKALAKELKNKYPNCLIVFGGHNVENNSSKQLNEYDFIDFLIHEEGEEPFRNLLVALNEKTPLEEVSNLSFRNEKGEVVKTETKKFCAIDYPSPYLSGVFDDIIKNSTCGFSATLETNRGCPFNCSYCDWGACKIKLRHFPIEKIKKEIEWIAKNKIELCFCADANFGILERDNEIADLIIDAKIKYGYPKKFRVTYTKDSNETVFNINKKLNDHHMSKGATLSFQSVDPVVLENIGRTNMTMDKFSHLMSLYNSADIPTHSEIILGLPGETYDSFCDGLGTLLSNGQHFSINVFNCEIFMNAQMSKEEYLREHGIKMVEADIRQDHNEVREEEVREKSAIVCETNTMSSEMWVKSNVFSIALQCFHCFGLLQCFAIYISHEMGVSYSEFYKKLIDWLFENPETIAGKHFIGVKKQFEDILAGDGSFAYFNPIFGSIYWPLEEGAFLEMIYSRDAFYNEISDFLKKFDIEEEMFGELMRYQKMIVKHPKTNAFKETFNYNFYEYFKNVYINKYQPLQYKKVTLSINDNNIPETWTGYAKLIVWYGRKGSKNIHTDFSFS